MKPAYLAILVASALAASVSTASAACIKSVIPGNYEFCTLGEFISTYVPYNISSFPQAYNTVAGLGSNRQWWGEVAVSGFNYEVSGIEFNWSTFEQTYQNATGTFSVPFGEAGAGLPAMIAAAAAVAALRARRTRASA